MHSSAAHEKSEKWARYFNQVYIFFSLFLPLLFLIDDCSSIAGIRGIPGYDFYTGELVNRDVFVFSIGYLLLLREQVCSGRNHG
jgi:hypothetical protein